jgi:hypothetical protein
MTQANRASTVLLGAFLSWSALQAQTVSTPAQTFVGTWVGTQRWAIATPPPGANPEQPVSIRIDLVDGTLRGLMTPFMGGEDGVVFADATIVGDELHASAVFGNPNPDQVSVTEDATDQQGDFKVVPSNGRTRKQPWKDTVKVDFTFRNEGVTMKGAATVTMNEMKWLSFVYDLSKKRARY